MIQATLVNTDYPDKKERVCFPMDDQSFFEALDRLDIKVDWSNPLSPKIMGHYHVTLSF